MRAAGRSTAGLTLVEVVVASAVLSVLLLGIVSSMAHGLRMEGLSREREAAVRTAQLELDNATAVATGEDFDQMIGDELSFDVRLDAGTGQVILLQPAATNPNPNGQTGFLEIVAHPDGTFGGDEHLAEARAVVRWRGGDGNDQEVVISTFKVRP